MRDTAHTPFEPPALHRAFAPDLDQRLARYLKSARGAFSDNTEPAIRAGVEIFTAWCEARSWTALPAHTDTVVAFIDAMGKVKAKPDFRQANHLVPANPRAR